MNGSFVALSVHYSCTFSNTSEQCSYEYCARYENKLAVYDVDAIRDETFEYFPVGKQLWSKEFVRHTLALWMQGVPFSRQAAVFNHQNFIEHERRSASNICYRILQLDRMNIIHSIQYIGPIYSCICSEVLGTM
eukprot:157081_1